MTQRRCSNGSLLPVTIANSLISSFKNAKQYIDKHTQLCVESCLKSVLRLFHVSMSALVVCHPETYKIVLKSVFMRSISTLTLYLFQRDTCILAVSSTADTCQYTCRYTIISHMLYGLLFEITVFQQKRGVFKKP